MLRAGGSSQSPKVMGSGGVEPQRAPAVRRAWLGEAFWGRTAAFTSDLCSGKCCCSVCWCPDPGGAGQAQHEGLGPSCGLALRAASAAIPTAALGFLSHCFHRVQFGVFTTPISALLRSHFSVEGNLPRGVFLLQKVREVCDLPAQTPSCQRDKKKLLLQELSPHGKR